MRTSQNQNSFNALVNIHNETTPAYQLHTDREPKKIVHAKNCFVTK